jgi:hypothetical protein
LFFALDGSLMFFGLYHNRMDSMSEKHENTSLMSRIDAFNGIESTKHVKNQEINFSGKEDQ